MTEGAAEAGWSPLERWALTDGFATEAELLEARRRPGAGLSGARRPAPHVGRDILAALRDRGLRVHLGDDGRPRVGPRELVGDADLALLREHRDEVLAALRAEAAPVPATSHTTITTE